MTDDRSELRARLAAAIAQALALADEAGEHLVAARLAGAQDAMESSSDTRSPE